jgi:hypothetical protein
MFRDSDLDLRLKSETKTGQWVDDQRSFCIQLSGEEPAWLFFRPGYARRVSGAKARQGWSRQISFETNLYTRRAQKKDDMESSAGSLLASLSSECKVKMPDASSPENSPCDADFERR